MKTLLTAKEVAEITGLAYTTVRRLAITPGANFPPSVKIGRSRRWNAKQLYAWIGEKEPEDD